MGVSSFWFAAEARADRVRSWLVVGVLLALALPAQAGEVARGDLAILGLALEVDRTPVTTAVDIPATVQTLFAGKTNDEAPPAPGLSVLGELTGPGIADPITLATRPGHRFQLPALHEKGEYTLQNIRLVGESGAFLQQAVPSFAVIQVADVLQTRVRVRQLTAAELRERGINVDLRNYEVYGRLAEESDEFASNDVATGNRIHYGYGIDGRLASITDPVGRRVLVKWDVVTGQVREIEDWRTSPRRLNFEYDAGRLARVHLPEVVNRSNARPRVEYDYASSGLGVFRDRLELETNLSSIKEPDQAVLAAGLPRVSFTYREDRVISQRWATGESATVDYGPPGPLPAQPLLPATATTVDVLGQERKYTLSGNDPFSPLADRAHVLTLEEPGVETYRGAGFGDVPGSVSPGTPLRDERDRKFTFVFTDGVLTKSSQSDVAETTVAVSPSPAAEGVRVDAVTTKPLTTGTVIPSPTLKQEFLYQPGTNFLSSIKSAGLSRQALQPHRDLINPVSVNDDITSTTTMDPQGRTIEAASTGGTDTSSAGSESKVTYRPITSTALHERGLIETVRQGSVLPIETTYEYPTESKVIENAPNLVTTTTELDAWDRPIRIRTVGLSEIQESTFEYDASGRVLETKESKGTKTVTTKFQYDELGRTTSTTIDTIATVGTSTTTVEYDLPARIVRTRHPGGAVTTARLDKLGRARESSTSTGTTTISESTAYDVAGNVVFQSDGHTATAMGYDVHGRVVKVRNPDGSLTTTDYDEWGNPLEIERLNGLTTVEKTTFEYTDGGRLERQWTSVDATRRRETDHRWDGAGRNTRVGSSGRASAVEYDAAGRMRKSAAGEGSSASITDEFVSSTVQSNGFLPSTIASKEKGGSYRSTREHHLSGGVTKETIGSLEWKRDFDEFGHVTAASVPSRPSTAYKTDARGSVEEETLPDGAKNQFDYNATGAQSVYTDPSTEATSTETDSLGRPTRRSFVDGTFEEIEYDGKRVRRVRDRQGRNQRYRYDDDTGQLKEIESDQGTTDLLEYDGAGRMTHWRTRDAVLEWSDFDYEGRPRKTKQTRFANGGGLTGSPSSIIDSFEQKHEYNLHGERERFTMPLPFNVPLPPLPWAHAIEQTFDAMGNVTSIVRNDLNPTLPTSSKTTLMEATHRAAGRADARIVHTRNGPLTRSYSYDPKTSQLTGVEVTFGGLVVGGSSIAYDGLQVSEATLLGVGSNELVSRWSYDERSRLVGSVFGARAQTPPVQGMPGSAIESLSPADFRNQQDRTPAAASDPAKSLAFAEAPGHKIDSMTRGTEVRPFIHGGAERVDDGRFIYEYDARGRLIHATEKSTVTPYRRITYAYSGNDRMVGRRAEYTNLANPTPQDWKLEDRPSILNADGLPADTTFVWDLITDRLASVHAAGSSVPLRQVIHGDAAYDDPLITITVDPDRNTPTLLYPIFDEAAAGGLQAILNIDGAMVARNLPNDPYGGDDRGMAGAAVDKIAIDAKKTSTGDLESINVTLQLTEAIQSATIAGGARLALVDENGAVLNTTSVTPVGVAGQPFALRWTLTAVEWAMLVANAPPTASLSIAATSTLRAAAWSADSPLLPPPPDDPRLFASPTLPVELREPLTAITTLIDSTSPSSTTSRTLYELTTLALAGTSDREPLFDQLTTARFQALPFADPMTGLVYARARWYDPVTGSFLSPDPLGYRDSSNLYAFGAGDPVNNRDPLGEGILDDIRFELGQRYTDVVSHAAVTAKAIKGIATSVGKTVAGAVAGANLLHEASKVGNVQAQMQVVDAAVATRNSVAQWGTAAGQAIVEPELIGQALNELSPDEFAEEISDATILTASFITPAAKAKATTATAPRVGINLARPKAIQTKPAATRFGPARGGGGDALAQAYARQVTNGAEKAIYVNGVEFEGIQQGFLVDAKRASGAGSFYDISGIDSFTRNVKIPKVIQQARRQLGAIQGEGFVKGIRWEIADARVAQQIQQLFVRQNIRITVVHNPAL